MKKYSFLFKDSLVVGDSGSDYNAANVNNIQFVLRQTALNKNLQSKLDCLMINNFL